MGEHADNGRRRAANMLVVVVPMLVAAAIGPSASGQVLSHQKVSNLEGGFPDPLEANDSFGGSCAVIGDVDGDGVSDLAIGAPEDDDGGGSNVSPGRGSVWVMFLHADGTLKSYQKISATMGGFTGTLDSDDAFGSSVAALGDFDGDGVEDIAVGAGGDDDGGPGRGALWLLFLHGDGTVKAHQKISQTEGGFTATLGDGDTFASSAAAIGDLDGDGVVDLAVGARGDDDGGTAHGALWILFLNADGTVKAHQKIASGLQGGFTGQLDNLDLFGSSVAALGDLDGDGVGDVAVGAPGDDDGASNRGALWVLFLNADGTVQSHQKISSTQGGFAGTLDFDDGFGSSVAGLGDLDGDGTEDLAAGAPEDDDGSSNSGAVWVVFLNGNGTVKAHQKVSSLEGGFPGSLSTSDRFGSSVASQGDLDGDGVLDLAVGAPGDDDGKGNSSGAAWLLFLNGDGTVGTHQKISGATAGFTPTLDNGDNFGTSVASLGDLDGDSVTDIAVGAPLDSDSSSGQGAAWILFLHADGTVKAHRKVSSTNGGFGGPLEGVTRFGSSLACPGDLDGDGVADLAGGEPRDDDGGGGLGSDRGAVWVLFLNSDGTVRANQKISDTEGGFGGMLDDVDWFGSSVAALGDLDGDGVEDLAVGAPFDDDGGFNPGAVWLLFLNGDGTVKAHQKISQTEGGFAGTLDDNDDFGVSVATLGDLDGDGVADLAVGADFDDDGGFTRGAVWILFLNSDGTAKAHQKISQTEGGFTGVLHDIDTFGCSLGAPGDVDGDGVVDLAVGACRDDDGGADRGAVWLLFLNGNGTVKSHQKISQVEGGFGGALDDQDRFGWAVASPGDLDGNGRVDLIAGAPLDDDGGGGRGAIWTLFLTSAAPCPWDLDGDGHVGIVDFLLVLAGWGPCPGCPADFDGDGTVGIVDFLALLESWGPCPAG